MNDFRFAEMGWLYGIWGLLVCIILLAAFEFGRRRALDRLLSVTMQLRLVNRTSLARRVSALCLFGCALLCMILALMRPQWGMTVQSMQRVDSQIMICLDVSKSMLAEDVVPNRLERAKTEIDALLGLMDEGQQVGLIAFAGRAVVMSPMTTDFGFLRLILGEADPNAVGRGGTRIGEAVQKAVDGFRETGDINRLILLITDGEDHDSFPLDAAENAKDRGIRIVSIGFGDESGSRIEITDPASGARTFLKDNQGNDVISRLDGESLREIALATEGAYIPAGTGVLELESIYQTHIRSLLQGTEAEQTRIIRNEGYQWVVLAGLIFLLMYLIVSRWQVRTSRYSTIATHASLILLSMLVSMPADTMLHAQTMAMSNSDDDSNGQVAELSSDNLPTDATDRSTTLEPPTVETNGDSQSPALVEKEQPPRALYNRSIQFIQNNPDRAEELLNRARNQAGVDGELRFRVLYNLGWVEVNRADALVKDSPAEALKHLEMAAARFSEAIRIRPESDEARQNLEILSQRILELRDSLRDPSANDISQRLDALIQAQRNHLAALREASELGGSTLPISDQKSLLRPLGTEQRAIISDTEKLARDVSQELETLQGQDPQASGAADQDRIRAAQLTGVLSYLDRAVQRLSRARSFTRRVEPARAAIRWSVGFSDTKRARDQLRNPIEVLGILIADSQELINLTKEKAVLEPGPQEDTLSPEQSSEEPAADETTIREDAIPLAESTPLAEGPAWLTADYLQESNLAIGERTEELLQLFKSVSSQSADSTSGAETSNDSQSVSDPNQATQPDADLVEDIRLAIPPLESAHSAFSNASESSEKEQWPQTLTLQQDGLSGLLAAAEYFYDIRRLIEVIYQVEVGIQEQVVPDPSVSDGPGVPANGDFFPSPTTVEDALLTVREQQEQNIDRVDRLMNLLQREIAKFETEAPVESPKAEAEGTNTAAGDEDSAVNTGTPDSENSPPPPGLERAERAIELAAQTRASLRRALSSLQQLDRLPQPADREDDSTSKESEATTPESAEDQTMDPQETDLPDETSNAESSPSAESSAELRPPYVQEIETSIGYLEELRQLYFSLLEHLRDTARRQSSLNDESSSALETRSDAAVDPTPLGSLQNRQDNLAKISQSLSEAFERQATQSPPQSASPDPDSNSSSGELPPENTEALQQASRLISEATGNMRVAVDQFDAFSDPSTQASFTETGKILTDSQAAALQKLIEAIQLLDQQQNEPQQGEDQSEQQQQQQDQQQSNNQTASDEAQQQRQRDAQRGMNAAELLQAIRDREAKRRRDNNERAAVLSDGTVEKDW